MSDVLKTLCEAIGRVYNYRRKAGKILAERNCPSHCILRSFPHKELQQKHYKHEKATLKNLPFQSNDKITIINEDKFLLSKM